MGIESPQDTAAINRPTETNGQSPPAGDRLSALGGQLLGSPEAGNSKGDLPQSQNIIVADAGPAKDGSGRPTAGDSPASGPVDPGDPVKAAQQAYDKAHGQWEKEAQVYWDRVTAAKKNHQFVMDFPPIYTGPEKPKTQPEKKPNSIPTINQMLEDARHLNQFAYGDKSKPPFDMLHLSEPEFKQRYAQEALAIGQQHGVSNTDTANIVRSIYAFEDGGWGTQETLSSMSSALVKEDAPGQTKIRDARRNFHLEGPTASSALGYNQLLMATTLGDIDNQSQAIANRLDQLAQQDPARAADLREKSRMIAALGPSLHKELMAMAAEEKTKKPEDQKQYLDGDGNFTRQLLIDFGNSKEMTAAGLTRQDMARAIHGLNLDGDVGPIIQARELSNLFDNASKYNFKSLLSSTEQGDTRDLAAYDALPADQKAAAVNEIIDLVKGPAPPAVASAAVAAQAAADDFARVKADLQSKLLALQPGIDSALSRDSLPAQDEQLVRTKILTLRDFGEATGPLSPQAQLLLNKVAESYYGGLTSDSLMPAALEMANLSGATMAAQMIDFQNKDIPTPNFFSQAGYDANPVTQRRTGAELLLQIQRAMKGPGFSAQNSGQADFEKAFQ